MTVQFLRFGNFGIVRFLLESQVSHGQCQYCLLYTSKSYLIELDYVIYLVSGVLNNQIKKFEAIIFKGAGN